MSAVKHYNWLLLSHLFVHRLRFFNWIVRNDTGHHLYKFNTNRITNSKMVDKMAAVQSKITAYRMVFLGLIKESLDGASDSLDGDREIKRRLIGRRNMIHIILNSCKLRWTYIGQSSDKCSYLPACLTGHQSYSLESRRSITPPPHHHHRPSACNALHCFTV